MTPVRVLSVQVWPLDVDVNVIEAGVPPDPVMFVLSDTSVSPAVAVGVLGAAGSASGVAPPGVSVTNAAELSPAPFRALTPKVYAVPSVRPLMVQFPDSGDPLRLDTVHVPLPGAVPVTMKDVGVPPPLPAVTVNVMAPEYAAAVTVGWLGRGG